MNATPTVVSTKQDALEHLAEFVANAIAQRMSDADKADFCEGSACWEDGTRMWEIIDSVYTGDFWAEVRSALSRTVD